MQFRFVVLVAIAITASVTARAAPSAAPADPGIDPAPCVAAIAAADDDRIVARCGILIEAEKTARPDRLRALQARAGVFARRGEIDRAIADYDAVLRFDPTLADVLNRRGELWRSKGDRPRALADFGAAIKRDSTHEAARANHKALALELEKIGAQRAVAGKPSFDCATARRPVEKTICADPALADLDRAVDGALAVVLRAAVADAPRARRLRRAQAAFVAMRNARFGQPGYDLKAALQLRLRELTGSDGH